MAVRTTVSSIPALVSRLQEQFGVNWDISCREVELPEAPVEKEYIVQFRAKENVGLKLELEFVLKARLADGQVGIVLHSVWAKQRIDVDCNIRDQYSSRIWSLRRAFEEFVLMHTM